MLAQVAAWAAVQQSVDVRRAGRIRPASRHRLYSCGAAVVDRLQRGDRARRPGRLAFRQYYGMHAGRLSRRGIRLICRVDGGGGVLHRYRGLLNIVIAFSPSTRDTMMVLALALHLDPVYVGAHHLARFLVVTFSVAIAASDRAAKDRGTQSQTAGANEDRAIIPRSITHWPNRGGCLDPRTIDFLLLDTRPGIATLPEILLLGAVAHHAGISNLGSFLGPGFLRQAKYSVRFIRWGRRNGDAFRF